VRKIAIFLLFLPFSALAEPLKTKFYNFDDLLINGQYKKPQVLYIDTRQKVKFEKLLKLKKNFLLKLKETNKDPSLR
jgi:hypothetical protein